MEQRIKLLTELSFFWGTVSIIALLVAWRKDFFKGVFFFKKEITIDLKHVAIAFLVYIITSLFITPLLMSAMNISTKTSSTIAYLSISNTTSFLLTTFFLGGYYLKNFKLFEPNISIVTHHFFKDFKIALIGWAIATPLVLFFSQVSDLIVSKSFYVENIPDQNAVSYVKMSFKHPVFFGMTLLTIVFLAPLVEEVLFRGFLQTWLKKHLGSILSIFITSLLFISFHFSVSQKIGNVVILSALFPLAFFLSFIYEKQKTLICPIFLHAIFNLSSILSLVIIGESS